MNKHLLRFIFIGTGILFLLQFFNVISFITKEIQISLFVSLLMIYVLDNYLKSIVSTDSEGKEEMKSKGLNNKDTVK